MSIYQNLIRTSNPSVQKLKLQVLFYFLVVAAPENKCNSYYRFSFRNVKILIFSNTCGS